ncbi:hypothetical protein HU200_026723 [Digitaria exilis]|uniref:Uncharacterized protein n=1 Tax=Digitaria exilis TaxID=1010633 RepID=A0A835BUP8_9POAL|nr:hypothetical protein HU200_026723 [Digitaria exilis]
MCLAPVAAMEMDDLQEADVLWPELDHDGHQDHCHCHGSRKQLEARDKWPKGARGEAAAREGEARRRAGASAPVGIRVGTATRPSSWARGYDSDESPPAFVPPHLELAARRRCSEGRVVASSSVCVGQGRTLKGRDLQSVRTAVLRMTGFLEN